MTIPAVFSRRRHPGASRPGTALSSRPAAVLIVAMVLTLGLGAAALPAVAETATVEAESSAPATAEVAHYLYKWGSEGQRKGQFYRPTGISVLERPGERPVLVVADTGNHRLRNYTHDGMFIDKWGTRGDGPGQFQSPLGVVITPEAEVWVADAGNRRLQRTRLSSPSLREAPGDFLGEIAAPGQEPFVFPAAVLLHGDALYVADSERHRILVLGLDGQLRAAWGAYGREAGELDRPLGLAIDADGHLLVVDSGNRRLQRFTSEGRWLATWGEGHLVEPRGVAVDADGNLWVTDAGTHCLVEFDRDGHYLGRAGREGSGDGELREPWGVAVDGAGRLYVTDSGNGRVQVFASR